MRRVRVLAIGAALGLLASAGANAAEEAAGPDYARIGFYVSGAGVYAAENFDTGGMVRKDDTFGADARFGYRAHRYFAVEANYQYLDQFLLKKAGARTEIQMHTATVNGKLFPVERLFPKWPWIQPYGLLGFGVAVGDVETTRGVFSVKGTQAEFVVRLGGGLDLYVTEHLALIGELGYAIPTGDLDDEEFAPFLVGVQYRF